MPQLLQVDYVTVAPFKAAAAKDRVSISDTRETFWFKYELDIHTMLGFCGLMRTTLGGRIKGVWVRPELRGNGHGQAMTKALIEKAIGELFFLRLEALAHNPKFYEALGWKRIGAPLPNGAVRLAKNY